jgi:hypothetical protein
MPVRRIVLNIVTYEMQTIFISPSKNILFKKIWFSYILILE